MHADPIADMLTRIRNAVHMEKPEVNVQASKVCEGVARVLREQGYIEDYDRIPTACGQDLLRLKLRYGPLGEKVIHEIKRCSKPARRVYCTVKDLPPVMGGLGVSIISTNKGVLSDQQCRLQNVGGELLCTVC
ncbi:MAG: 30S ribosomal protein S8 [Phycisphaerae bacterium SM23_30]|nr:MAG: 30S ribosomal protein S8 [Phycisphaerae bacterium SM23_30]